MRESLKLGKSGSMPRRGFVTAVCVALTLTSVASYAIGSDRLNTILYFGHQPAGKPAFGQTILITGQIARGDNGSINRQRVQLWFSGRMGIRAGSVFVNTDRFGKFAVNMTIPANWRHGTRNGPTWVDVNISCTSIGVQKLFRVRDKD